MLTFITRLWLLGGFQSAVYDEVLGIAGGLVIVVEQIV